MPNKFIFAQRDFDRDRQEVSIPVVDAATVADYTTWAAAVDPWVAGSQGGGGFFDEEFADAGVAAASPIAQSKLQAIMEVQDTVTGSVYSHRIPFPDMGKAADGGGNAAFVVQGGLTVLNPAHADYAQLQTVIETFQASKIGNNPVTLQRIYIEE